MASDFEEASILEIAAPVPNATAAGPFGSNLVSRDYTETGVPVIRGQNLLSRWVGGDFAFVSPEKAAALRTNTARPGDIVFTQRGTLGQVAMVPDGKFPLYVISQSQMKLSIDSTRADSSYVYYACTSEHFVRQVLDNAVAAGVPHINLGTLRALTILLPELTEQTRISGLLGALDDRIDLLRQTNATLEAIAQALFKSWFVDFDPVRAKAEGREPEGMDPATAALFPSEFEESELGLIPKGWRWRTAGELYDVGIGKTPPRKEQHWFSDDSSQMPWVSIRDMGASGLFVCTTSEYLRHEAVDKFNIRRVPAQTVLLSFKLTVGRLALTDVEMTTNEAIAHFKATADSPSQLYLYCYLREFDFSRLGSTSSIATATNSKAIRQLPVLLPDHRAVRVFDDIVSPLFERVRSQQRQIAHLAALRDTLLPRLISGKLRLPEAEAHTMESSP